MKHQRFTESDIKAVRSRVASGEPISKVTEAFDTSPQRIRYYLQDIIRKGQYGQMSG